MKNIIAKNLKGLKQIAIPSLIFIVLGVVSILLVEVSIILTTVLMSINIILYLFLLYYCGKNYKLRYLILGKKFKDEWEKLQSNKKWSSEKEKLATFKWAKRLYRQSGTVFYYEEITPNSEMWDMYQKNLSKAVSDFEDSDLFVLCILNDYICSGILYQAFELLVKYFSYEKYKEIICTSIYFPTELKEVLTSSLFEKAYNIIYREECEDNYKRTEKEDKILKSFEQYEIKNIKFLEDSINAIFENVAIAKYIEHHKLYGIENPEKNSCECVKLYFSKDGLERICIALDKSKNLYSVVSEIFEFEKNENNFSKLHSRGYWLPNSDSNFDYGLYDDISILLKDLKNKLKDYVEYSL